MCFTTGSLNISEIAGNNVTPCADKEKNFKHKGWGTRHTFIVMGFLGFVLCYALRFNLSIAIVSMVKQQHTDGVGSTKISKFATRYYKINQSTFHPEEDYEICPRPDHNFSEDIVKLKIKEAYDIENGMGQFSWTDEQQGLILGSFFWGYVITQYPGGRLSHKYGPKWIFSIGILLTGILSLLIPIITTEYDYIGLVVIRIVQGLAEGVTLPAIMVMVTHWSPIEERSRMTNWVWTGIPIGTAVIMIVGGYLIHFFGWPSVFYATGVLSIVWFAVWSFVVFNGPSDHPRISSEELVYIQSHLKGDEIQEDIPTPWKSIFKSMPVWAILITDLGDSWSHYLLHVEVPIYLSAVHGFEIETNGWFSALPQFLNCVISILIAYMTDFIIMRKFTSVLNTRRLCSTIALWGSAAGFVGMILGGCNTLAAVVCLNIAAGIGGASNSGWVVNNIEIAPNHAGTISGLANTVGNCLGFVAPYVTGLILTSNPTLSGWRTALMIPAIINFSVNLFYLTFASAEEQPWNRPKEKKDHIHLHPIHGV